VIGLRAFAALPDCYHDEVAASLSVADGRVGAVFPVGVCSVTSAAGTTGSDSGVEPGCAFGTSLVVAGAPTSGCCFACHCFVADTVEPTGTPLGRATEPPTKKRVRVSDVPITTVLCDGTAAQRPVCDCDSMPKAASPVLSPNPASVGSARDAAGLLSVPQGYQLPACTLQQYVKDLVFVSESDDMRLVKGRPLEDAVQEECFPNALLSVRCLPMLGRLALAPHWEYVDGELECWASAGTLS
jgi:hypothetical protein